MLLDIPSCRKFPGAHVDSISFSNDSREIYFTFLSTVIYRVHFFWWNPQLLTPEILPRILTWIQFPFRMKVERFCLTNVSYPEPYINSYDLWTVSYSILYRTSTWCPAVRKDNFSSPTAMPTVLKLRPSNRFPVLGVMLCSILLPMHTLRIMSSNNE